MLFDNGEERAKQFEVACLEDLVRPNHLLRKIKKHVDFGFIKEKVKGLYSEDSGRPDRGPHCPLQNALHRLPFWYPLRAAAGP